MISFTDVTKRYPDGTLAVDGLNLDVRTGELTVLLGTSGFGKTTALRMVNRLIEPTSGTIALDGRDVTTVPVHELRRGIGYIIQQPSLFPHRSVADNIATVPRLIGCDKGRRSRALELLEDPKGFAQSEAVIPLATKDAATPRLRQALDAVSAQLTTENLKDMVKRVEVDKDAAATVAVDFLTAHHLD